MIDPQPVILAQLLQLVVRVGVGLAQSALIWTACGKCGWHRRQEAGNWRCSGPEDRCSIGSALSSH